MRLTRTWSAVFLGCCACAASAAPDESPRLSVINAMILRPEDPWPRGHGHVILAAPGSREDYKAYHEPGGGFSPTFGSFGVSIWVTDAAGRIVTTSGTIPLGQLAQRWAPPDQAIWPRHLDAPSIQTETPYYRCTWAYGGLGRWRMHLRNLGTNDLDLVIRSVGPAGGPIKTLYWLSGSELFVNDRWCLRFAPKPSSIEVVGPGDERAAGTAGREVTWPAERAWGYAKLRVSLARECWLTIEDSALMPPGLLSVASMKPGVEFRLPDPVFAACFDAQVAQLLMGLVGNETRPGDPNNYPLNWLRDGAYVVVALARAGQLTVAEELTRPFAEHDFFGGFGSEADAPGLALWALEEVASRLKRADYDQWIWPHVRRKAELILQMLSAAEPLRLPFTGPVVPGHRDEADLDLVCDAAREGLIFGRMDWHRPVLFVNAVSYRGLWAAAAVADRVDQGELAEDWRGWARELRHAWAKAFASPEADNERTYICGLHPSWVVVDRTAYGDRLEARRAASHDARDRLKEAPLWTYFNLAEAHQWLILGQPDKAWNDVHWFWEHQASPGLFTWWEGRGEENTFHRWETVRGWVAPAHVTPHYWTAAEMLLLQLDMLVLLDQSGVEPVLVLGAGVPPPWLDETLEVKDVPTQFGKVHWQWKKGRMTARVGSFRGEVRLGPAFPRDAELRLRD